MDPIRLARVTNGCVVKKILVHHRYQILRGVGISRKKIWKANMHGKIKQFLWKACSNALPTLKNLKKRRVVNDDTCFQCSSKAESSLHALWECEVYRQVWDTDFSWINRQIVANGTVENLVEVVLEKPHQLEVFAVTAWFLWMWRNKLRVKEDIITLNRVVFERISTYGICFWWYFLSSDQDINWFLV